jgi:hypothetical protein
MRGIKKWMNVSSLAFLRRTDESAVERLQKGLDRLKENGCGTHT